MKTTLIIVFVLSAILAFASAPAFEIFSLKVLWASLFLGTISLVGLICLELKEEASEKAEER